MNNVHSLPRSTAPTAQGAELLRRAHDNAELQKEIAILKSQLQLSELLRSKLLDERAKLQSEVRRLTEIVWPAHT